MWARLNSRFDGREFLQVVRHGPYVDGVETEVVVVACLGYIDHMDPADARLTLYKLNDALANVRALVAGRVEPARVNHEDIAAQGYGLTEGEHERGR